MRTTIFPSVPYKFLTALALVAMLLAALPAMQAFAASITVTNPSDDLTAGNGCSLREALVNANNNAATHPDCVAGSGADVITLASGSTHTLSVAGTTSTTGDLDISDPAGLTIQASSTTAAIIDGGDIDRVLDVSGTAGSLTLTSITIRNGNTTAQATTTGGGIGFGSTATLTLTNSTVSSNVATSLAGCGAGIYNNNAATINITNSTISDNSCSEAGADGGGLFKGTGGILNITNSTFSGNSANDDGGGMRLEAATVAITNSTFAANTAGNRGGAVQVNGATVTIEFSTFSGNAANAVGNNGGGAIQISLGSAAINRSILANATAGMDCHHSAGGTGTFANSLAEQNVNCTGTILTSDPGLGALANNGGPTLTMEITDSSPAFNAAASCNSITTDQRGVARPQDGSCDLGAFEVAPPTVVSILRASPNPVSSFTVNYTVTFSEAVTGVGSSDFSLTTTGSIESASVTNVSGSGTTYTVTVNTGTGTGTIRLDIPVSATIIDSDGNALTGLPFEAGEVYDKVTGPPGAATLVSPSGATTDTTPTYTWNKTFGAEWYYLWVNGPSGNGITQQWYEASAVCGASTCSVTPSVPASLSPGAYTWWIRTWNSAGYGPWSTQMNFSITATPPPGAATLVSPSGNITDTTPVYTWNKVTGATWYYLWVNAPSGNGFVKEWFDAAVVCGATTCTATAATTLGAGAHTWWIQTWNAAGGYGAWSNSLSFSVSAPAAATLVSPSGAIADTSPTFTWNKVAGADWYYLWVNGPSGNGLIQIWYDASVACGPTTCTATPPGTLASGSYTWWVRTWSNAGYGPWSNSLSFSLP